MTENEGGVLKKTIMGLKKLLEVRATLRSLSACNIIGVLRELLRCHRGAFVLIIKNRPERAFYMTR